MAAKEKIGTFLAVEFPQATSQKQRRV